VTQSPEAEQVKQVTGAKKLLRSGLIVSAMTMLSRVLGLARDVIFAHTIGAGAGADAFFVAFKIPNFLRRLFAEGAFSQAFVPVLSEYREKGSIEAVLFAPGFWDQPEKFALTQEMLRITFPYLLLISLTGLAGAILNSYDRFAIPALTPVLLNLCLISAAVWLSPYFAEPAVAVAWGVLAAGAVQLAFQIPFLSRIHLLPTPKVDFKDAGVRRVLLLMAPAIFGVSVAQINLMLDTILASFLPTGSVSWLYYSDRLVELPLGIFAIAIATVILPTLSRQHVSEDETQFNATLDWALRWILLIALPASVALLIMAQPILTVLFEYGKTSATDILMASFSLQAYSVGLLAFMLIKVLAPAYFAQQDTKTPVKIGVIAMGLNMLLNVVLVIPFHFLWQIGHVGLALATALSAFVNAGLLYRGLRQADVYQPLRGWGRYVLRLFTANTIMVFVLLYASKSVDDWSLLGVWERVGTLVVICVLGLITYFLLLLILGVRLKELKR
jgi:putative peptidoglycan lipid II flippase